MIILTRCKTNFYYAVCIDASCNKISRFSIVYPISVASPSAHADNDIGNECEREGLVTFGFDYHRALGELERCIEAKKNHSGHFPRK